MKQFWALCALVALGGGVVFAGESLAVAERTSVKKLPIQQERILPATITQTAPGSYFIDYGKADFGGLEIEIGKPEAGRTITVRMGEALAAPQTIERKPKGSIRFHTANIVLKADQKVYVVPLRELDWRLMPKALGPVMPFRYVELENAPALEARDVRQVVAYYPFNKNAAAFKCSNEELTAIWEFCRHTMKVTSFGGVFIDGDRERKPYEADAYINQLGWYYCTDDLTLPRFSHEYLIQHPTWPTEWILFSVLMAWEDYRYTGDKASLVLFYDDLKAKTLIALERPDGLITTASGKKELPKAVGDAIHIKSIRDIVDWPLGERDGNKMPPVNTVVNAFHCVALQRMAMIAGVLDKTDDEKHFREAAFKALQTFNSRLLDPNTGIYVDGDGDAHSSLHANMFPLAFGLVPQASRAKVAEFVKSRGMACSVYGAQFLMDALFDAGLAEHALALMTADNDRSWSHMVKRTGSTVALEAWDSKYKPNLDWNHAWGAAPANVLPRKVLGVEPGGPGYRPIIIKPRPGALAWAEGRVPTKLGPVAVRFDQDAKSFRLNFELPPDASGVVAIPKGPGTVTLDGKPVQAASEADGYLYVNGVGAGTHSLKRE